MALFFKSISSDICILFTLSRFKYCDYARNLLDTGGFTATKIIELATSKFNFALGILVIIKEIMEVIIFSSTNDNLDTWMAWLT